jgi:uncharacterized membrane protein
MIRNTIILAVMTLMIMQIADAAAIEGTVYDWNLEPVINAKVYANSTPKQAIVAKTGDYSLTLNKGVYEIKAIAPNGDEVAETITVADEGNYTLDLIILPSIDNPEDLFNESDIQVEEDIFGEKNNNYLIVIGIIILMAIITVIAIFFSLSFMKKKEKEVKEEIITLKREIQQKEVDPELAKLVEAIKSAGGRTTQKEIRKQFPSSEAKISLMITELEKKGIVEKIKKGRGNVLVLK